MPIFVKIEEYKEVKDTINVLKAKIEESKRLLRQLNEIKDKESLYLDEWAAKIIQAENKVEKIINVLG